MSQRFASFLVVFLLMFLQEVFAQGFYNKKTERKNIPIFYCLINSEEYIKNRLFRSKDYFSKGKVTPLSADYYTKLWGFFCRKEWEIEKLILVPVRVRLGSLEFTNWMERKPNAILVH